MKKQELRLNFCKGDIIVIIFVSMLAIVTGILFWQKTNSSKANVITIYKEGEKIREVSLDENTEIAVTDLYTNKIEIFLCRKKKDKNYWMNIMPVPVGLHRKKKFITARVLKR